MKTAQQVYDGLVEYINKFSNPKSAWYTGIATNVRGRLFNDHGVDEKNGQWAYDTCTTSEDARAVEQALLELGCKGGGVVAATTQRGHAMYISSQTRRGNEGSVLMIRLQNF